MTQLLHNSQGTSKSSLSLTVCVPVQDFTLSENCLNLHEIQISVMK